MARGCALARPHLKIAHLPASSLTACLGIALRQTSAPDLRRHVFMSLSDPSSPVRLPSSLLELRSRAPIDQCLFAEVPSLADRAKGHNGLAEEGIMRCPPTTTFHARDPGVLGSDSN